MGDVLSLVEKTKKNIDEKKSMELAEKMKENTFNFDDFLDQLQQIQNMGPLKNLMAMIPGMANNPALQNVDMDPKDLDRIKAIIYSMTNEERENPDVLNPSRRRRIAKGSAQPIQSVNRLIKQFNQMKKMMNQISNGNMSGMENMMQQTGMGKGMNKLSSLAMKRMSRKIKKNKRKKNKKKRK